MPGYSEFGLKARAVMLQKHITMTDIAAELGISVTYVSEIFKGTRKGEKYRKKITQLLGLEEEASLCQNN